MNLLSRVKLRMKGRMSRLEKLRNIADGKVHVRWEGTALGQANKGVVTYSLCMRNFLLHWIKVPVTYTFSPPCSLGHCNKVGTVPLGVSYGYG